MNKIGIIQPGRLGDMLILLPALKHLHDQGNAIVWPVFKNSIWMFSEVVDYINFVPIENDVYSAVKSSKDILTNIYKVDKIFDTAATFPGSTCTDAYVQSGDGDSMPYDVFKYNILGLPIDLKWNLRDCISRDMRKEEELYDKLVKNKKYAIVNPNCSSGRFEIKFDGKGGQIIEVTTQWNMFHWIKILENAQTIALLNSGMLCLVDQLNLSNKKIVFKIPNGKLPVLKNKWEII